MIKLVLNENESSKLILFILKNIHNIKTLKSKIIAGEIDCCAIRSALIVDYFQILVAAEKVIRNKEAGKLKTKSLNTELLYNLSISRNITQSLNNFGINDKDHNAVIAIFEESVDNNKFELLKNKFEGDICGIEEISAFSDIDLIKKTYKITDKELEISELIDSIVSRISTKDFGFS